MSELIFICNVSKIDIQRNLNLRCLYYRNSRVVFDGILTIGDGFVTITGVKIIFYKSLHYWPSELSSFEPIALS